MTPEEALAQALAAWDENYDASALWMEDAAAVIAALPKGWALSPVGADAAAGRALLEAIDIVDEDGDYVGWTLYRNAGLIVAEAVDHDLHGSGPTIEAAIAAALEDGS